MTEHDEDTIRLDILNQLRDFEIKKSTDPNMRRMVALVGKMAGAVKAEFGTVERICSELEEEGLIKYNTPVTLNWDLKNRERREIAITAEGRNYLKNITTDDNTQSASIHAEGDVTINVASDGSQISTGNDSNQSVSNTTVTGSSNVASGDGNAISSSEVLEQNEKSTNTSWLTKGVVASLVAAIIIAVVTWLWKSNGPA